MAEPITLDEMGQELYFYFTDLIGRPVALDTSIGSLKLYSVEGKYSPESGITSHYTEVEVEEIDFMKNNDTILWFNNSPTRGVLKAKN